VTIKPLRIVEYGMKNSDGAMGKVKCGRGKAKLDVIGYLLIVIGVQILTHLRLISNNQ
jgi:hypothetical protein